MRSQEIRLGFKKAYTSYDAYGDRIQTYIGQEPISIWLSYKDVVKFDQTDLNGIQYDYIGITRDRRADKNDLIDEKLVVYKIEVNRWNYLFLQDIKGDDDEL